MQTASCSNLIIDLWGPSGSGKTSVSSALQKLDTKIKRTISVTTRKPRPGEKDQVDYYFMSKRDFEHRKKNNEFAETAEVYGHYYGTLKSEIDRIQDQNCDIIFNIDPQGLEQIEENYSVVSIFIEPPSIDLLGERLRAREQDDEDIIERRIQSALSDLKERGNFKHRVVNDVFETCVQDVYDIIKLERKKTG